MPIGPALPPHLAHLSASSATEAGPSTRSTTPPQDPASESDDDDYGPALPPHLAAARTAGPSRPTQLSSTSPSVPSARYQQEENEESDDDIGPKPPGAEEAGPEKSGVEEFLEREKRRAERIEEESKPKALKRDEWMLVPPEAGIMSSLDPLRKRPTTFNRSSKEVVVDNTMWTETPAQKQQRMADEAAGVRRQKDPVRGEKDQSFESKGKRQRDEELKAQVERHSKSSRGESLLDQYKKKGAAKEDERGIWDHERDMGITGRLMSDKERQTKINEARGLNDRFGHGKGGAFNM